MHLKDILGPGPGPGPGQYTLCVTVSKLLSVTMTRQPDLGELSDTVLLGDISMFFLFYLFALHQLPLGRGSSSDDISSDEGAAPVALLRLHAVPNG